MYMKGSKAFYRININEEDLKYLNDGIEGLFFDFEVKNSNMEGFYQFWGESIDYGHAKFKAKKKKILGVFN